MIINGVTLPDIPAEVLAEYPYAIVFHLSTGYMAYLNKEPYCYVSTDKTGIAMNFLFAASAYRYCALDSANDESWDFNDSVNDGPQIATQDVVWSNHDIYYATAFDQTSMTATVGTEIYFSSSVHPERVSIGRSLVDGYAREVQRLTGTTDQMNAVQIREKLSAVKAGIKIGDVVLPPIPADVLAQYPYALICVMVYNNANIPFMFVYTTPFVLCPGSILGYSDGVDRLITETLAAEVYLVESNEWSHSNSVEGVQSLIATDSYVPVWANHDIYTVTGIDTSEERFVLGTEIYFSERQNFNGVWLPKIPEDVLTEYPYAVIFYTEMTLSSDNIVFGYGIWLSTSRFYHVNKGILSGEFEGYELIGSLTTGKNGAYSKHTSNKWNIGSTVCEAGSCAVPIEGGPSFLKIHNTVWANHDIYEVASANTSTGEYTTDGVYFPPLEDIDSNRVSIGYELFNSIVEEVQRLSGETDKMNALRAYWKLTTVV